MRQGNLINRKMTVVYDYVLRHSYFCWNAGWAGICHGDELFMMFGDPVRRPMYYNSTDIDYATNLIHVFTTYGKLGAPPSQSNYSWPAYQDVPQNGNTPTFPMTPTFDRPTWPNNIELNPLKQQSGARYKPYTDCDQFWSKHMDIWMPTETSKAKYRRMAASGKQWHREEYFYGSS